MILPGEYSSIALAPPDKRVCCTRPERSLTCRKERAGARGDNAVAATAKLAPHRSRWVRILGVAFVMYVLSYIDRTNIAMAIPAMASRVSQ